MSLQNRDKEAADYWNTRKSKVWVCDVNNGIKIVRARDLEKAKASALAKSFHKRPRVYGCRLAHPEYDLGGRRAN